MSPSQGKLDSINMDLNRRPVFIFLLLRSFDVAIFSGQHRVTSYSKGEGNSTILLSSFLLLFFPVEWRSLCCNYEQYSNRVFTTENLLENSKTRESP